MNRAQAAVGGGTLLIGLGMAAGATQIGSQAGYSGVGPNFVPWVVSIGLVVGGALLLWQAASGGFRDFEPPSGAAHGHWIGFAWVTAGLLASAALITRIGFVFACTLCFVLAVQGFRGAEGRGRASLRSWLLDVFVGLAIAAPVYWMFTKLLGISLPGLTSTGWL